VKSFEYEKLEIGENLGTKTIEVTQALVREYAELIESDHPWYRGDSPFGGPIAPPTVFDNETLRILDSVYARFGSIHAKQTWEFHRPVRVGTTVTVNVRIIDKFVKRDRGWLVMELTARDDDGTLLCSGQHTSVVSLTRSPLA
jgi:acyl dehydratase